MGARFVLGIPPLTIRNYVRIMNHTLSGVRRCNPRSLLNPWAVFINSLNFEFVIYKMKRAYALNNSELL